MTALCHIANDSRHFFVHNMLRVEDYNWDQSFGHQQPSVSPTVQRMCAIYFMFAMRVLKYLHIESKPVVIPSSVNEWLTSIQFEMYSGVFHDNGYDRLSAFVGLDDATLESIGISLKGHRGILVREAVKLSQHLL